MEPSDKRVDVGQITLVWGAPASAKAQLREESLRKHLERPIAERLAAALALVGLRRDVG